MNRLCHNFPMSSGPRRQLKSTLLSHVRIVTDPNKLARLYAEADKQRRYAEAERKGIRQKPTS